MSQRLLIADDHPLVREGMALAARASLPGTQVDAAGTIAETEALIARGTSYRLILLDLILPDTHGFSGLLRVQHAAPTVPIVIVSARARPELVAAARALGAAGYISKAQPLDEMVATLRRILAGETIFAGPGPGEQGGHHGGGDDVVAAARAKLGILSGAQLRVLLALADARLNKQIAGDLGVSEATVKAHLTAIFRKLGVTNRTQAILAIQPLVDMDPEPPV